MQVSGMSVKKSGEFRIVLLFRCLFLAMIFVLGAFLDVSGQGNLMIYPRRVVFEGSAKSQEITLANTGNDTAKYVVSIVQMRMKEDGSYQDITVPDSGQLFADKYLRFYPRTVTILPKKSQIVKMQFVKSANMLPAEYRSHIYFRAIPKSKPLGEKEVAKDSTPVSAKLTPVFGITIPVIIRVGESTAQVKLTDMLVEKVKDTVSRFKVTFNRSGNFSVYGDLTVTYITPLGKETKVASVKGIGVYTPNLVRRFQCNLDNIPGIDYKTGKLHVVFSTIVDTKPQRLAEAEFPLQ